MTTIPDTVSTYERHKEHLEGAKNMEKTNALHKHNMKVHVGEQGDYKVVVMEVHKNAMKRQVTEKVKIERMSRTALMMNSKNEWGGHPLPRVILEEVEKENEKEEIREEKESEESEEKDNKRKMNNRMTRTVASKKQKQITMTTTTTTTKTTTTKNNIPPTNTHTPPTRSKVQVWLY